ncbi:hypothetical protein PS726_06203 [Pseudomonas fluorescens]|uniref:hypothetical protein n=1 Tax=Pseudomonas fluorescens TaxID=294 RepID=UPI00123F177E|nr:hypothetical protein [Pseudomonas fluorescens]VVO43522.1 hypothetical protein PS726_06203 [Pseudomonas fluorescens]
MGLNQKDLNPEIRGLMIQEMDHDLAGQNFYLSPRLNAQGRNAWHQLLKEASANHSDDWLANEIARQRLLNPHDLRQGKPIAMRHDAHQMLAEGEFNRFFMRGICLKAIEIGAPAVVGYRARASQSPRRESLAIIGKRFDPSDFLDLLRSAIGADTPFGYPGSANSGLSVEFP